MLIKSLESEFGSSINAILYSIDLQGRKRKIIFQLLTKRFTQICHVLKAPGIFLPQPFLNLLDPEFFFSRLFQVVLQGVCREVSDIGKNGLHAAKIRNLPVTACWKNCGESIIL